MRNIHCRRTNQVQDLLYIETNLLPIGALSILAISTLIDSNLIALSCLPSAPRSFPSVSLASFRSLLLFADSLSLHLLFSLSLYRRYLNSAARPPPPLSPSLPPASSKPQSAVTLKYHWIQLED